MKIAIDCSKTTGRLTHFWRGTGFTPASLLLNPDMQQQLTYAGSLPHSGIAHVRIHFLLDLLKAKGLESRNPEYDWSALDAGIDVLVGNRLKPFFELMGNPSGFFSDFCNDGQLHAWRRMVRDVAVHLMQRYGRKEVESWYFETWNEPDIGWWHQWPQVAPFRNYYDACSEGLRDANPKLLFGGPGTCKTLSDLFKGFVAHCDSGTNYFTGKKDIRLDFISVHEKGAWANKEDVSPNTAGISEREAKIIDYIRGNHPRLARVPFMNNECDPIVGWSDIHTWHARPYYAALICKVINQHQVKIVEEKKCDYHLLSNDNGFVGTWGMRTLLTELTDQKRLERGEFELIKKPALNAMTMLALLGDKLAAADGCGDALRSDVGVIATRRGGEQVAVLLYNSRDRTTMSGNTRIELSLRGIPFEKCAVAHYRIDEEHGDPFLAWEADGARSIPSRETIERLRDNQELGLMKAPGEATIKAGRLALRFDLPLPSVSLIVLTRKRRFATRKITGLRAQIYKGVSDLQNVMLSWDSADSRALRTYEVLFSESKGGPFSRINKPDLLCSAFLHARRTSPGRGYYRIRAVDFWGRSGWESDSFEI